MDILWTNYFHFHLKTKPHNTTTWETFSHFEKCFVTSNLYCKYGQTLPWKVHNFHTCPLIPNRIEYYYDYRHKLVADSRNQLHKPNLPTYYRHIILFHLAHSARDNMAAILHTASSNSYTCAKVAKCWLTFHWNMFPMIVRQTISSDNGFAYNIYMWHSAMMN